MSEKELIRQLAELKEKGFDDSFAAFCARTFSSFEYPAEHLAPARMHAHYLRLAIDILSDGIRREAFLREGKAEGTEGLFREVTVACYREALGTGRPFGELFVEKWCRSLSRQRSVLT